MSWDNLPLAEKAEYIKVGVHNGLRDIDSIRNAYNSTSNSTLFRENSQPRLSELDGLQRAMNYRNLFEIGGPTGDTPPSDGTLIYNGLVNGVKDIVHGIDNFAEQAEDPLLYTTMGLEGATVVAPNPYTAGAAYATSLAGAGIDAWQGARALYKAGSAAINGDWETAKEEAKTAGQNGIELGLGLVGAKFAKKAANSYNVAEGTRTVTKKRVRTAGRKTKVVTKKGTVTAKSKAGEQALRSAAVSVPIEASQAYYHNREGVSDFFAQQERLRQERIAMAQPVKRKKK